MEELTRRGDTVDISQAFQAFIGKTQLPACRLTWITTEGAPVMVSRGKFPQRFQELCPEIKEFHLVAKHAEQNQLSDDRWLLDLAFGAQLTNMLRSGQHDQLGSRFQTKTAKSAASQFGKLPKPGFRAGEPTEHMFSWTVAEKYPSVTFLTLLMYVSQPFPM